MVAEEGKDKEAIKEQAEAVSDQEESKEAAEEPKEAATEAENEEAVLPELARPLDKMTVKELKEIGLQIPSLVGVHGMKKAELLTALKEVYGVKEEVRKADTETIKSVKVKIRELKGLRAEALKAGEKPQAKVLRRRINRLKKRTRKIAAAAA